MLSMWINGTFTPNDILSDEIIEFKKAGSSLSEINYWLRELKTSEVNSSNKDIIDFLIKEKNKVNKKQDDLLKLEITDKLKFTSSTIFTNTNKRNLSENVLGSVLFNALNMPPTISVFQPNGEFSRPPAIGTGIEVANPLAQVDNAQNRSGVNKISGSYGLNYKINSDFSAETRYQANYAISNTNTFNPLYTYGNGNVFNVDQSTFTNFKQNFFDYTFDAFLKYEKVFNDKHDVKAMVGTSVFQTIGRFENILTSTATGTTLNDFILGSPVLNGDGLQIFKNNNNGSNLAFDSRLLSYFGRLQYAYDGKYLFSAVVRRDGSSNFGPKNKFGFL